MPFCWITVSPAMMLYSILLELMDFVSDIRVEASAWYHLQHYHQEVA